MEREDTLRRGRVEVNAFPLCFLFLHLKAPERAKKIINKKRKKREDSFRENEIGI